MRKKQTPRLDVDVTAVHNAMVVLGSASLISACSAAGSAGRERERTNERLKKKLLLTRVME